MIRSIALAVTVLLPAAAAAQDADLVKDELDKARAVNDAQNKQLRTEITAWFDRREETARKDGNKATVDQVKLERRAFVTTGLWPEGMPAPLRQKVTAARHQMELAYGTAVKGYTKVGKDAEATAVEKLLAEFRRELWQHVELGEAALKDGVIRIPVPTGINTRKEYTGSVEVVLTARTERENIRLAAYGSSCIIFNWENNPSELRVHRPGGGLATAKATPLRPNTWYTIRWQLSEQGMRVTVDGKVVFAEQKKYDLNAPTKIGVYAATSPVEVKAFYIVPLENK